MDCHILVGMLKKIARLYYRGDRVASLYSRMTGLGTSYLVVKEADLSLWWLLLLIPAFYIGHLFDKHYLLPLSQDILIDQMKERDV